MCILKVTSDDTVPTDIQHKVQNDVQHAVSISDMIPDKVKLKIMKVLDRYMKHQKNIIVTKNLEINEENYSEVGVVTSVQMTSQFKKFSNFIMNNWKNFQQSDVYKIFFQVSQPAHVIAIIAVLAVMSTIIPKSDYNNINNANQSHSKLLSFIYLTSFILHMGSQFWMTFVSGLSLYFALPKKDFSQVQRVLFPRYFTINTCFSITTLLIFLKHHSFHTWDAEISTQVGALFAAFLLELVIRLYLTPPLIGLLTAKVAIEKAAGIGNEVGSRDLGPLEKCPHYLKINRAFRKFHTCIAIGNILTMVCTVVHLSYISSKICF